MKIFEKYKSDDICDAPKKILILGNGFDLAHGLPTKYSDFLDFCQKASKIYINNMSTNKSYYVKKNLDDWEISNYIKDILSKAFEDKHYGKEVTTSNEELDKLYTYIKQNIWYNYLLKTYNNKKMKGENWIDFESEISSIIQLIDKLNENLLYEFEIQRYYSKDDDKLMLFLAEYVRVKIPDLGNPNEPIKVKMKKLRESLYNDLEKLIYALEIYLKFVEDMPIKIKSNDIVTTYTKVVSHEQGNHIILFYNFNYVINFNYTHTYKNVYNMLHEFFYIRGETKYPYKRVYKMSDEILYIHGETNHYSNNMVLGIDEYWSEKERDNHTNFTIFKKFAQRIQKRTGIENYKWFEEIEKIYKNNQAVSEVHIFGHSLDVTDKDILYDYLESEATSVTIYCKDKETEGEYIANVIKIIGEKRLLEKVNQDPPKLKFVIQQPMVPIEEEEKYLSILGAAM